VKDNIDIWFMDECHFQQHGSRLSAWFHKDVKDPIVLHASTRKKVGIIGAVRSIDGTLVACEEGKFNSQTIEAFFDELILHRELGKTMVIILDNARFHHAKALSGWLEKHAEIFHLDFLPPYSPELNHIERVWKSLRRLCTHNQYFENLDNLRKTIFNKILEWASPNEDLARLCAIS
jgi:transposase